MIIPAICDQCYTFFPSGIVTENAINITLSGNKSGPCPKCGGMGHIPDGTFNFINNTIEILQAPERTISELTQLEQILRQTKSKSASPKEIKEALAKESSDFKRIADFLPSNKAELYAFIALIIEIISLILAMKSNNKAVQYKIKNRIEVNTVINNVCQH